MLVLITYDVSTTDRAGQKRLQKIAKACLNYGQRVQNSVFECVLDPGQLVMLRHTLINLMDPDKDSIRFYQLGKNWHHKVEHIGAKETYDPEGTIII